MQICVKEDRGVWTLHFLYYELPVPTYSIGVLPHCAFSTVHYQILSTMQLPMLQNSLLLLLVPTTLAISPPAFFSASRRLSLLLLLSSPPPLSLIDTLRIPLPTLSRKLCTPFTPGSPPVPYLQPALSSAASHRLPLLLLLGPPTPVPHLHLGNLPSHSLFCCLL